jgi:hypothetical protein
VRSAAALALCDAADFEFPPVELALASSASPSIATGVPRSWIRLDRKGERDFTLPIDCRSLEIASVPPPELTVIVMHSGLSRALTDSGYAQRRRECEEVARRLGLRSLREATAEQVADEPRGRHVVSENARVLDATRALADGDADRLGVLLSESHRSLRDDFRHKPCSTRSLARGSRRVRRAAHRAFFRGASSRSLSRERGAKAPRTQRCVTAETGGWRPRSAEPVLAALVHRREAARPRRTVVPASTA